MESKKLSRILIFVDTEVVGMILEQLQKFSDKVTSGNTKPLPNTFLKEYLRLMMFFATEVYRKNGIEKEDLDLLFEYFRSKLLEQKIVSIEELLDFEEISKERYPLFSKILKKETSESYKKLIYEETAYLNDLLIKTGESDNSSLYFTIMADYMGLEMQIQGLITGVLIQLDLEIKQEKTFKLEVAKKKLNQYYIEVAKKSGWSREKIQTFETTTIPKLSEEEVRKLLADLISQESNQYLKDKRFDKAGEKALEALTFEDDCALAWGTFGLVSLMVEKRFSLAVLLFKMALRYDKFFILHYYLLAQSYFSLGNYLQALVTLTKGKKIIDSSEYIEFKAKREATDEKLNAFGLPSFGPFPLEGEKLVEDHLNKLRDYIATDDTAQKLISKYKK